MWGYLFRRDKMEWIELDKLIGVTLDIAGPIAIGGKFAVVGTYVGTSVYAVRNRTTIRARKLFCRDRRASHVRSV